MSSLVLVRFHDCDNIRFSVKQKLVCTFFVVSISFAIEVDHARLFSFHFFFACSMCIVRASICIQYFLFTLKCRRQNRRDFHEEKLHSQKKNSWTKYFCSFKTIASQRAFLLPFIRCCIVLVDESSPEWAFYCEKTLDNDLDWRIENCRISYSCWMLSAHARNEFRFANGGDKITSNSIT